MRINWIVLAVSCLTFVSCSSDTPESKVPSVVKNTLKATHPLAVNVEWEKQGNAYEAEYEVQGTEIAVKIGDAGKYLMEKQDLKPQQLPTTVVTAVQQTYKDYKIEDTEKLVVSGSTFYQVELGAKWKQDIKLVLLEDGSTAQGIKYWD